MQKFKQHSLNPDTIKTFFLKGIRDEYLYILNVMGKGDMSYIPFDEIVELCQKYSRGRSKIGKRNVTSRASKSTTGGVTREEIGILLENFKTYLLSTLGTQVDVLKENKKQQQEEQTMSIFFPKCRKKHLLRECHLDNIHVCGHCKENHVTDNCPTLKELQEGQLEETQGFYYVAPRRAWKPCFAGTSQQCPQQFPQNFQYQNSWNTPIPWQVWPPQQNQNQPSQSW